MIKKLFLSIALLATAQLGFSQSVSIAPNSGNRGQSLPVVISGQNTSFTSQGSTSIFLKQGSYVMGQGSQTAFTNISVINPLMIAANLHVPTNAPLGLYDMFVTSGTTTTQAQAFTVTQGTNTNMILNPNGSKPGKVVNVSITVSGGSFKTQAQVVETVWLSKGTFIIADIRNIVVVNSNTFTADVTVPANAPDGLYAANVFTDDGMMFTKADAFTVNKTFSHPELEVSYFNVYPNPTHEFLQIDFESTTATKLEVHVYDLAGKEVVLQANKIQKNQGSGYKLDLTDIVDGVYVIEVTADGQPIGTRKFIKH